MSGVKYILRIPNSNTLYEKYELELFVIISYDNCIKGAHRGFLLKLIIQL